MTVYRGGREGGEEKAVSVQDTAKELPPSSRKGGGLSTRFGLAKPHAAYACWRDRHNEPLIINVYIGAQLRRAHAYRAHCNCLCKYAFRASSAFKKCAGLDVGGAAQRLINRPECTLVSGCLWSRAQKHSESVCTRAACESTCPRICVCELIQTE